MFCDSLVEANFFSFTENEAKDSRINSVLKLYQNSLLKNINDYASLLQLRRTKRILGRKKCNFDANCLVLNELDEHINKFEKVSYKTTVEQRTLNDTYVARVHKSGRRFLHAMFRTRRHIRRLNAELQLNRQIDNIDRNSHLFKPSKGLNEYVTCHHKYFSLNEAKALCNSSTAVAVTPARANQALSVITTSAASLGVALVISGCSLNMLAVYLSLLSIDMTLRVHRRYFKETKTTYNNIEPLMNAISFDQMSYFEEAAVPQVGYELANKAELLFHQTPKKSLRLGDICHPIKYIDDDYKSLVFNSYYFDDCRNEIQVNSDNNFRFLNLLEDYLKSSSNLPKYVNSHCDITRSFDNPRYCKLKSILKHDNSVVVRSNGKLSVQAVDRRLDRKNKKRVRFNNRVEFFYAKETHRFSPDKMMAMILTHIPLKVIMKSSLLTLSLTLLGAANASAFVVSLITVLLFDSINMCDKHFTVKNRIEKQIVSIINEERCGKKSEILEASTVDSSGNLSLANEDIIFEGNIRCNKDTDNQMDKIALYRALQYWDLKQVPLFYLNQSIILPSNEHERQNFILLQHLKARSFLYSLMNSCKSELGCHNGFIHAESKHNGVSLMLGSRNLSLLYGDNNNINGLINIILNTKSLQHYKNDADIWSNCESRILLDKRIYNRTLISMRDLFFAKSYRSNPVKYFISNFDVDVFSSHHIQALNTLYETCKRVDAVSRLNSATVSGLTSFFNKICYQYFIAANSPSVLTSSLFPDDLTTLLQDKIILDTFCCWPNKLSLDFLKKLLYLRFQICTKLHLAMLTELLNSEFIDYSFTDAAAKLEVLCLKQYNLKSPHLAQTILQRAFNYRLYNSAVTKERKGAKYQNIRTIMYLLRLRSKENVPPIESIKVYDDDATDASNLESPKQKMNYTLVKNTALDLQQSLEMRPRCQTDCLKVKQQNSNTVSNNKFYSYSLSNTLNAPCAYSDQLALLKIKSCSSISPQNGDITNSSNTPNATPRLKYSRCNSIKKNYKEDLTGNKKHYLSSNSPLSGDLLNCSFDQYEKNLNCYNNITHNECSKWTHFYEEN